MNEIIQTWAPVAGWILSIAAIAAALWFKATAKQEAEAVCSDLRAEFNVRLVGLVEDYKELEGKVIDHDRRLITVEKAMEYFPTSRDINRLGDKLAEMSGDMKRMSQEMKGLHEGQRRQENSMSVINETLLRQSSR